MGNLMKSACRLVLQPIFPTKTEEREAKSDGRVASKLFLSHILAGLFVIFGVISAEKTVDETVVVGKWAVLTVSVTIGLISALSLLISRCRRRHESNVENVDEDPSVNLQLAFLWIFSLAFATYLSLNIIIFLECVITRPDDIAFNSFLLVFNLFFFLFIVSQIVLVTCNKGTQMQSTFHLHISIVCILAANFSIWYSSTIHSMFANGNYTHHYNNSCSHESKVQKLLGKKVSSMLSPPQLEFCILASTLLVTLWQNAIETQTSERRNTYSIVSGDIYERHTNATFKGVNGIHIIVLIFGIFINVPNFVLTVLLNFVYEWKTRNVLIAYDIGNSFISITTCVIVYICIHTLKADSKYTRKPLIIREYILILSSTGTMAYLTFEFLAGVSGFVFSRFIILSSITGMLETFLQTLLLINSFRYTMQRNTSNVISSCSIILVITNLTFWLENTYNSSIVALTRYNDRSNVNYVDIILVPLMIFYRFFSGISAYSMYKRFRIT